MTTATRRALPNHRRAFRNARLRERTLSDNYERQQQAYRELEALYSAMTERAMYAEQKLKMTENQLKHSQYIAEYWRSTGAGHAGKLAALRRAAIRYLNLAVRVPAGDFDPIDVCYVVTEYQHKMIEDAVDRRWTSPPTVVCLCGSTRFYEAFQRLNYEETMAGNIVLSVGFYPHSQTQAHGEDVGCTAEQKLALDELHKRKIDIADEILVLNCGGYVGESTRSEITYAVEHGKRVRWLEPLKVGINLCEVPSGE